MMVEQLDVTILGREYRLACAPDEKSDLMAAVTLVDKKMQRLKESRKMVGSDRIAVMTALQLAHEILAIKSNPNARQGSTENDIDTDEIRHRIESMNDMIDTVLAPQEKLF
jgi:cell division protein ZapA